MKEETYELRFSEFLNSLMAVLIPMMILLSAFVIDAGVLFFRALPADMPDYLKYPASAALGFAIAFPLLLTAVNSKLLPPWIKDRDWVGFPLLFAIFTVVMTLLFFDIFAQEDKAWHWYVLIVFLSLFVGLIDFLYAYLFVGKYQEVRGTLNAKEQLEQLKEKHRVLAKSHHSLTEASKRLLEDSKKFKELRKQLTCKYCGKVSGTLSANRSHEGRCEKKEI